MSLHIKDTVAGLFCFGVLFPIFYPQVSPYPPPPNQERKKDGVGVDTEILGSNFLFLC